MLNLLQSPARLVLAAILLVSLATTGFAHRLATPAPDAALEAFLATGGSLADICADHTQDHPHDDHVLCEACAFMAGVFLPAQDVVFAAFDFAALGRQAPRALPVHAKAALDSSRRPRAPPVG